MALFAADHFFYHAWVWGIRNADCTEGADVVINYLSAEEDDAVDAYILESPVTEVGSWTRSLLPWIARVFVRFEVDDAVAGQNNLERVGQITLPLLVISGTADDVTPPAMANELYEHSASPRKEFLEITGGSHNNLPNYSRYRTAVGDFIESIP